MNRIFCCVGKKALCLPSTQVVLKQFFVSPQVLWFATVTLIPMLHTHIRPYTVNFIFSVIDSIKHVKKSQTVAIKMGPKETVCDVGRWIELVPLAGLSICGVLPVV
jgi:hypothetical protein